MRTEGAKTFMAGLGPRTFRIVCAGGGKHDQHASRMRKLLPPLSAAAAHLLSSLPLPALQCSSSTARAARLWTRCRAAGSSTWTWRRRRREACTACMPRTALLQTPILTPDSPLQTPCPPANPCTKYPVPNSIPVSTPRPPRICRSSGGHCGRQTKRDGDEADRSLPLGPAGECPLMALGCRHPPLCALEHRCSRGHSRAPARSQVGLRAWSWGSRGQTVPTPVAGAASVP